MDADAGLGAEDRGRGREEEGGGGEEEGGDEGAGGEVIIIIYLFCIALNPYSSKCFTIKRYLHR